MSSIMCDQHQFGSPITIVNFVDNSEVMINNKELDRIFLNPKIKNRKIVVVSLIGAFRGGKSFLLGYILRFLYAHYPSINNSEKATGSFEKNENWMGDKDEALIGFTWSSGTTRITTGINMWNDIFLHTMEGTGEEIAIILVDTQGLFDNVTTQDDNSRIFGLGTLVSSVQILNLNKLIQEDQLQYLRFATEFASFTGLDAKKTTGRPFQKLIFLIRDWGNPEEFEFGMTGGNYFLKDLLKVQKDHKPELKLVRQSISKSFDQINCCLLPYPGNSVASAKSYDGCWSEMELTFKEELQAFVENLLLPKNLVLKKINSVELTCSEYRTHIESYFQLFQSSDILQIQNVYDATVENSMNILLEKSINAYNTRINCETNLTDAGHIPAIHEEGKKIALDMFKNGKKMGTPEHEQKFADKLDKQIERIYNEWKEYQINIIKKNQEKLEAENAKRQAEEELKKSEEERIKAEEAEKLAKNQAEQAEKEKQVEIKKAKKALKAQKQAEADAAKSEEEKQKQIQVVQETELALKDAQAQIEQTKKDKEATAEEAKRLQKGSTQDDDDKLLLGASAIGGPIGFALGSVLIGLKKAIKP